MEREAAPVGRSSPLLPHMRLDELLAELHTRLEMVLATRDRVHALLDAVVAIGSDLDLETTLRRLVEAATTLVDARYGALGVVGEGARLVQFVPVGLTDEEISAIPHWPHGRGILGLLIKEPRLLRLGDLTKHPEASGFPPGHPPMHSFLGVPIRVRDEVFGNLYLTEKRGGGEFDEEDEIVITALATAAGVAIENARLYEEGRRRERWLEASSRVTQTLLSGITPGDVLPLVARQARLLTDADTAALALIGPNEDILLVEAVDGRDAEGLRGLRIPVDGTLPGQVFKSREPTRVADAKSVPELALLLGDLPIGPVTLVPLGVGDAVRGVLGVSHHAGSLPFSEATERMLQAFAAQAGVALELAERRRDAERLVVLEDRDRIAKDLHDIVIQRLYATAMTLSGATRIIEKPEAAERVRRAVDDLDETIRQIRTTIFALQPSPEAGSGSLRSRVLATVDAATESLGFTAGVRLEGYLDTAVPQEVGDQLLAVLREALSNVARHARASWVNVLVEARQALLLRVEDNGIGIEPGSRRSGLRNMADRAKALGGTFDVRPRSEGGTVLEWQVPLPT